MGRHRLSVKKAAQLQKATEARIASSTAAREKQNTKATKVSQLAAVNQELFETKEKLAEERAKNEINRKEINQLKKTASTSCSAFELLTESNNELSETRKAYERTRKRLTARRNRSDIVSKKTKAVLMSTCRMRKSKKKEKQLANEASGEFEEELTGVYSELQAALKKIENLSEEVSCLESQLKDKEEELTRAHQRIESQRVEFEHALSAHTQEVNLQKEKVRELQYMVERLRIEEDELTSINEELNDKIEEYRYHKKCADQRISRLQESKDKLKDYRRFVQDTLQVFDKGAYAPRVRGIVRFMITRGCPLVNAGAILNCIYQILMKPLLCPSKQPDKITLDQRTVKRFMVEGLVAARLQQFLEIMRTPSFTSGSDGTTHRSLNYESLHLNVQAPDTYSPEGHGLLKPKIRFAGVRVEANHRASTQVEGELAHLHTLVDTFERSPLAAIAEAAKYPISEDSVFLKWVGTHGDHAEDQNAKHRMLGEIKKERLEKALGERELYQRTETERAELIQQVERIAMEQAGGQTEWDTLSGAQQDESIQSVFEYSLKELALTAKQKMTEAEIKLATDWIRAGCQMHKDLNAVKGGCQALRAFWKLVGLSPCTLANRDNAAVLEAAEDGRIDIAATEHAVASSTGGAVKLAELAGALFNHKDDKKGHQDIFRDFVKLKLALTFTFPDTSNTRFGSYLEAAAALITRPEFYIEFLDIYIRNMKEKRTLNHMEGNVLRGLQDSPTRTELGVLTVYLEGISHPYISDVRGGGLENSNALDKGELHKKVVEHINKLIQDPNIILSPTANSKEATLGAREHWKWPEAMRAVHRLAPELPFFSEALVAFLEGAKTTWIRFSAEFVDGGYISTLTEEERRNRWIPTTNDANEGALGQARVLKNRNPTSGETLLNTIMTYTRNNTQDFMDFVLVHDDDQAFLRTEARALINEKPDQNKRKAIAEQHMREAEAKRLKGEAAAARKRQRMELLTNVELVTDTSVLESMTVDKLKEQLAKYRMFDPEAKAAAGVKKKEQYLKEVLAAATRYMRL